jgi:hypothetical protein
VTWGLGPDMKTYVPSSRVIRKPMFEHVPVWDFYPDMSAKTMNGMDGYFLRLVMSRSQVLALGKRTDFFKSVIDNYLKGRGQGNYKPQPFETELRTMGVKVNVNDQKPDSQKYELLVWFGPCRARRFRSAASISLRTRSATRWTPKSGCSTATSSRRR